MQTTDLIDFLYTNLVKEGIFIIMACFIIGTIVKNFMPKVNNDLITLIVSVCGVLLSLTMPADGDGISLTATKGLILGWASTGGYEFWKHILRLGMGKDIQTKELEKKTKE